MPDAKSPKTQTENPKSLNFSFSDSDRTPDPDFRTVTVREAYSQIKPEPNFNDNGATLLQFLSDDIFQMKYLGGYAHRDEFIRACEDAVDSDAPLTDRSVLGTLCGTVMDKLKEQGVKAPDYWTKLLRTLRAGGPIESYVVNAYDGPSMDERATPPPTDVASFFLPPRAETAA